MSTFPEYANLDLAGIHKAVLAKWKQSHLFEQTLVARKDAEPWIFFEGPPSANGLPGIHHVMGRSLKDVFCRYKTQKGFLVDRKAGWDTHGLPVELGVEKELGITKEDIGKSITIEEYNDACRTAVMRYTGIWKDLTDQMGYWVDMDKPYVTYEPKYMESVWWLLAQLYKKGLIYKGYTIQPYSPKAGTGLSSHELNQPGCYQNVKDNTVVAQFKMINNGQSEALFGAATVHFLAWTTTPWTLPSNTALTVGPKIEYSLVHTFNQYTYEPVSIIAATPLLGKLFGKKFVEGDTATYEAGAKKDSLPHRKNRFRNGFGRIESTSNSLPYALARRAPRRSLPCDPWRFCYYRRRYGNRSHSAHLSVQTMLKLLPMQVYLLYW